MKVAVAGKGGVGKTTIAALLAAEWAQCGLRTLAVDCDPNPNLAESFGLESAALPRFDHSALRRAGPTLELAREPELAQPATNLWLLGGPPGPDALVDAVARGIAGVLVADRFERVVTDLGAGPEFVRLAVGGVLNPADLCVVLTDGSASSELAAARIEKACRAREVESVRRLNRRGEAGTVASDLAALLDAR